MSLLEQPSCHEFVDPYVEHDSLTLLLDLILLKRGVYRHLLFNRGAKPRRLIGKGSTNDETQIREERVRYIFLNSSTGLLIVMLQNSMSLLFQLGFTLVALDACRCLPFSHERRSSAKSHQMELSQYVTLTYGLQAFLILFRPKCKYTSYTLEQEDCRGFLSVFYGNGRRYTSIPPIFSFLMSIYQKRSHSTEVSPYLVGSS